jgi:heat shock protein HslJ
MKHLFLFVLAITLVNCKAPTNTVAPDIKTNAEAFIENDAKLLIGQKYELVTVKDGDALYAFIEKKPVVTFGEEGQLSTKLSANRCGGSYEADNKKISFSADACTEMCCDAKKDMVFQGLLSKSTFEYQMTKTDLILTNEDKMIRLKLKN